MSTRRTWQERTRGRTYLHRVLDDELDEKAAEFAAISIEGPKGVGKTETAQRRARTDYRLDGPAGQVVAANPRVVLVGEPPILIDEWQRVPATWDVVRRAVDDGAPPGSYLLAGSASEHGAHTGAGRILTLRMRPLTLSERGIEAPAVSLRQMLGGERPAIEGQTNVGLEDYAHEIVGSGFPATRGLSEAARGDFLDSYLQRIVERDFEEMGRLIRRPATLLRWMNAYAAATASTATLETIRDAATGGEGQKPAKTTTQPYREILQRLFIVDPLPAWAPTRNRISRLAMPPKHHLADPALAASLLGVSAGALPTAWGSTSGRSWTPPPPSPTAHPAAPHGPLDTMPLDFAKMLTCSQSPHPHATRRSPPSPRHPRLRIRVPHSPAAQTGRALRSAGTSLQLHSSCASPPLRRGIAGNSFDAMPRAGTSRNDLDPARLRSYLRARGIKTDSPRLRSLELLAEYAGGSVVDASAQHSTTATPNLIGERWESPWPPLSV